MATGSPNYANSAIVNSNVGTGIVAVGDTSKTAPVNAVTVLTPGASGSRLERITLQAVGPTVASVLRLFLHDGTNFHLKYEIQIPSQSQVAGGANFLQTLEAVNLPNMLPLLVAASWSLRATINDTQLAQEIALNNIAQAQTVTAGSFFNLNGSNVTAGSTAAIAALAAPTANVPMTLTSTPYVAAAPAQITLTSAANLSATNFFIIGRNNAGALVTETLAGPNANTVYSANVYKGALQVIPLGTSASTVSVGYSTVAGPTILPLPSKILLTSGANLSASNITITGTAPDGGVLTETIAGPNVTSVQSANIYASITSIKAVGALASNITVGTPAILSGISVLVDGGNF